MSQERAEGQRSAVPDDDQTLLRTAALDYIQGFYTADAQRMERAVHPELAKRILRHDPSSGRNRLEQMSALTLIQNTRAAGGRFSPDSRCEITILDRFEKAACVRVDAASWVDFLHLSKVGAQWKIVNVLWELRPAPTPTP